jgi:thiol-disulfide isomerase/thioredoxin
LVIAILYATGLHTEVLGNLQRAMLWTGLFDADTSEITTTKGSFLSDSDYRFDMEKTNRETVSLSDFRGDVIFVNVWASWCPPCVAEMPTIETLYNNLSGEKNIRFILLAMDQEQQKAIDFMERKEFPMPYFVSVFALPNHFRS